MSTDFNDFGRLRLTLSSASIIFWSSVLVWVVFERTLLISTTLFSVVESLILLSFSAASSSFVVPWESTSSTVEVIVSTLVSATFIASWVLSTAVWPSVRTSFKLISSSDLFKSSATWITPSKLPIILSIDLTESWAELIWSWRFWKILVPSFLPSSITVPSILFTRFTTVVTNDSLTSVWTVWTTLSVIFVAMAFFFSFA